ncbi:TetR/AcrR family transcriptional regulator [Kitasatospora cineracea]|uniref:TetR family transcriptional regulator n=1 Tax=Kitasatospora cineracea TaxID=88074 RepID=A0A3N4RY91_9ACTN|nr:TetR/AcrR family transcriptional regulator [Kitasatospora cineracea]ROR43078.1 TetR family transcriptional regulator [Kitasatospora cineracea]RPE33447.1 TetR family transcriptional regulator [Kitasatospora cineracea]
MVIDSATDGRVQRGNETRRAVLGRAVQTASVEGLEALSIGRLATDLGLSKSGVFAAFGSKEELQLATVRAARRIFHDRVVTPALDRPAGAARLLALCEHWLDHSRNRVFAGGCFFYSVTAEFDARPGPLRDVLAESALEWEHLVADLARAAGAAGELPAGTDPEELALLLTGLLESTNSLAVLHDDPSRYDRTLRTVRRLLGLPATG